MFTLIFYNLFGLYFTFYLKKKLKLKNRNISFIYFFKNTTDKTQSVPVSNYAI